MRKSWVFARIRNGHFADAGDKLDDELNDVTIDSDQNCAKFSNMACTGYLDQVGLYYSVTEIQDDKTRYLDFKNDISKLWGRIQLSAFRYLV